MPSETTADVGQHFTHYSTYSYSECGRYDDTTGYTKCNYCGEVVEDEWEYLSEVELAEHTSKACIERVNTTKAIVSVTRAFGGWLQTCTWCKRVECVCPF